MQQYLINTTAIWLLSLLLFDLLLRRENFHSYNRGYLIATLLLGMLLPLFQWGQTSFVFPGAWQTQVERVVEVKQTIAAVATPAGTINWQQWLFIVYLLGVVLAVGVLLADIIKLTVFLNVGKRSFQDSWIVIETGREHAPFSFRNTLFVCSVGQYSSNEWNMILLHERRHSALFHFADLLLMHIARILFWFHPLVYVYNRRLLLVHEYQADSAAAVQPQQYGKFLIEQAVLHAAPSVTHSFNRSPIKNRIVMLTRNSTAASRAKMLVLLPLMAIAVSCFSKNATPGSGSGAFKKEGNTVTYKGNKFTLSEGQRDTITVLDPVSGQELVQVRVLEPAPLSMNGRKIYNTSEVTAEPLQMGHSVSLEEHLMANLAGDIDALPDGDYRFNLSNIIIDDAGKVAYYEFRGITGTNKGFQITLPNDIISAMAERIDIAMGTAPLLKPGMLNGKPVLVNAYFSFSDYRIGVHSHVTTYARGK